MHLGRLYPQLNRPDMAVVTSSSSSFLPPRKWRMTNDGTSALGTLAVPWLNVEILSTLSTLATDGQSLWWDFDHPTVDDNFIRMIWLWFPVSETSSPAYEIRTTVEFWHQGTRYGRQVLSTTAGQVFFAGGHHANQFFWGDLVNTTLFQRIAWNSYFAAVWADDPDYQPYKTNPF